MDSLSPSFRRLALTVVATLCLGAAPALAQVTPAAGSTPPDDTPSIKVGSTVFLDYTFQSSPKGTDADGNTISPNAFDVGRAYININGKVSHLFEFRVTPDVTKETGSGSSVNGSYVFRVKYAFGQINLGDWLPHGSWIRFGMNQTPYLDFMEGIYRYRFQGTMAAERAGYITSSDAGVSLHVNFPHNYGDVHVGFYNGDGYSHFETSNEKAFQGRVSVRPAPRSPIWKGLRLTGFLIEDHYVKNAPRRRGILAGTYEQKYATLGVEYFTARDQKSATLAEVTGNGYSIWFMPKSTTGWEGLVRYDHVKPSKGVSATRNMTIAGVSYWFPHTGGPTAAILLDYEQVDSNSYTPAVPTQKRVYVHMLVNF